MTANNNAEMPTITELTSAIPVTLKKHQATIFNNKQLEHWIIADFKLNEDVLTIPREKSRTEFQYRLAWARSKAKMNGVIKKLGNENWEFLK